MGLFDTPRPLTDQEVQYLTPKVTQYDPGVFTYSGRYYAKSPDQKSWLDFGTDPGVFHIGQPTPTGGWNDTFRTPTVPPPNKGDDAITPPGLPTVPTAPTTPVPPSSTTPSWLNTLTTPSRPTPLPPGDTGGTPPSGTSTGVKPFTGVTSPYIFAGFSPQNHLGETPTVTAPKYAVMRELANLSNQSGFNIKNFASQAAADLNAEFGTTQFKALDNETLAYGDEYVHGAPTGYGLQRGQFDPNAPGEFFWGATGGGTPSTTTGTTGTTTSTPSSTTYPHKLSPDEVTAISQRGGITQYDPGVYTVGGHYYVQDASGAWYDVGTDPSVLHIGQPTPPGGWPTTTTTTQTPGTTTTTPTTPVPPLPPGSSINLGQYPESTFNDPATSYYEQLLKLYSQNLLDPVQNPARDALYQQLNTLVQQLNGGIGPFEDAATARMNSLKGPLYTDPQVAALQTQALDGLRRQRQQAIQGVQEQFAALGHGIDSGTMKEALIQVNRYFDGLEAQQQNTFSVNTINQEQQRQDQAVNLAQALTQSIQGRQAQQLGLTGNMADLTSQTAADSLNRQGQAVSIGGMLADLPAQRLQLAEQAFGIGNGPSQNLGSNAINLLQTQNQNAQFQAAQRQQFALGLGQYLGYILSGAFNRPTTVTGAQSGLSSQQTVPNMSFGLPGGSPQGM